ncbi:MAG: hypothetical protein LBS21_02415 [Clostridiales bacterium]|jgi:GNAT superfamily N-acetyltransferase|nr:hypothetical protein [Clostridiales bacterium]
MEKNFKMKEVRYSNVEGVQMCTGYRASLKIGDTEVSYAEVDYFGDIAKVDWIETYEEHRQKGYAVHLMQEILNFIVSLEKDTYTAVYVVPQHVGTDSICIKLGFKEIPNSDFCQAFEVECEDGEEDEVIYVKYI